MSMPEPKTFADAVSRLEEFLRQNSFSVNLIWVEPANLILSGRRSIYVKVPVPSGNLERARDRFAMGMGEGLGIALGTICELPDATCSYAWVPKDRKEQQEHLMGPGLKVSAAKGSPRISGIRVTNPIHWQLLKLRHRKRAGLRQHLFG